MSVKILTAPLVSINVNSNKVLKSVLNGLFNARPSFLTSDSENSPISASRTRLVCKSTNDQEDTYTHTTITGEKIDIVTTGVDAFRGKKDGECLYCRLYRTELPLGICLYKTWCEKEDQFSFYVKSRRICSPSCLISQLAYMYIPPRERDNIERDTLAMLRAIYGHEYTPVPADDFELLQKNGGSLTEKEWLDEQVRYDSTQVRNVKIIPIKQEFLIHKKKNLIT